MSENWNTVPHVTQFDSVDVTDLNSLRKKLAPAYKEKGARLTMTPFVMKALVSSLDQHKVFASSLDEATQELVYKHYRHVGIAVDTEAGLVVPVIRDVDKKSLLELSEELSTLATKAKDRKLTGDDMSGGVITISNQGAIGGAHFTPIVNRPEVAIIGLGRGAMQPAVVGDKIAARLMMPVTLSYDHRVIDGGTAARFMVDFVKAFESFSEENSGV
jgi:pyruvate dehydrogenase E2 component (dihydrolipoamide acetyltransferase)